MNCYEFSKRYGLDLDLEIGGENADIRVSGFYRVTIAPNPDLPRVYLQCNRTSSSVFETNFVRDGVQCQDRGTLFANIAMAEQSFGLEYIETGEMVGLVITGDPPPVPDPVPPDWIPYGDSYLPPDWPREYKGVPTLILPISNDPFSAMRRRNILASEYTATLQLWAGVTFYGDLSISKTLGLDEYAVAVTIGDTIGNAGTYSCALSL